MMCSLIASLPVELVGAVSDFYFGDLAYHKRVHVGMMQSVMDDIHCITLGKLNEERAAIVVRTIQDQMPANVELIRHQHFTPARLSMVGRPEMLTRVLMTVEFGDGQLMTDIDLWISNWHDEIELHFNEQDPNDFELMVGGTFETNVYLALHFLGL